MSTIRTGVLAFALASCPSLLFAQPSLSRADYSSQAGARGVAAADFNGDGWLDVAHANTGRNTVTILFGERGQGSLRQAADIAVGVGPFDMVSADFNRDGAADLAVANADNDSISVLIGNGRGGFTRSDITAPGNPRGITAADMDGDAKPDIVYTAYVQNRVQILNGDGAGGFRVGWSVVGVAHRPQGVAAADFNRDGRTDLAVAYVSFGGGLAILYGQPSGAINGQVVPGLENLNVVAVADLNRDGWADVAAASAGYNRLGIFHGGAAGVTHRATYFTGVSPRGVAAADLDRNGTPDILTANKESNTVSIFMATAAGNGPYETIEIAAGLGSRAIVAADFNHDGLADAATANQDEPSVTMFWNMTNIARGGFAFRKLDGSYGFNDYPDDVMIGDFDEDGWLDRLTLDGRMFFGNGTERQLPFRVWGQVTEVNGDGHLDLVAVSDTVRTFLGDGRGGFTQGPDSVLTLGAAFFAGGVVGDVDRDGKIDIVAKGIEGQGDTRVGYLFFAKGTGDGRFQVAHRSTVDAGGPTLTMADVDGDARLDVVHVTRQRNGVEVAYGDGIGAFPRLEAVTLTGFGVTHAHVADLNHDGRPDMVIATFDGPHVVLGREDGGLADPVLYRDTTYRVSLGDVNNDGHLDIVGNSAVRVRFGLGDGTFGNLQGFASYVSYPVVADMNNDGLNDIIAGDGPHVLLNLPRTTNTPPTVTAPPDLTVSYADTFNDDDEDTIFLTPTYFDADLHMLRFEWRDAQGTLIGTNLHLRLPQWLPGTYELTVTAFDDRGGQASDTVQLTILPIKELVLYAFRGRTDANWVRLNDPTAAMGLLIHNPDRGAPKVTAPLAEPAEYFDLWFVADPTQEYKLWVRGKALNDYWANDSAWIQFQHSTNAAGAPAYRIGTSDALPFNLEECSGCGISGWGWEDDGWGRVDAHGVRIRFAQGGWQRLRVQRREDGVSIDQIVLSAERFLTTRPGTAKNDTTILSERYR